MTITSTVAQIAADTDAPQCGVRIECLSKRMAASLTPVLIHQHPADILASLATVTGWAVNATTDDAEARAEMVRLTAHRIAAVSRQSGQ